MRVLLCWLSYEAKYAGLRERQIGVPGRNCTGRFRRERSGCWLLHYRDLEPREGFATSTWSLRNSRSASELTRRGGSGWNCTSDKLRVGQAFCC